MAKKKGPEKKSPISIKKRDPKGPREPIRLGSTVTSRLEGQKWWQLNAETAAKVVYANIQYWINHQAWRTNAYRRHARSYQNIPPIGIFGVNAKWDHGSTYGNERLSFNVSQSCVDTLTSKIGKNKIRPDIATSGGDWIAMHQAEQLNLFSDGIRYENNTDALARMALRDSLVWGDGIIQVRRDFGRVTDERVLPIEIFIDEAEGQLAQPRQLHRARQVDREVARHLYPGHDDVIDDATQISLLESNLLTISDLITVVESWHLPSSPDADDGKYLVSIDGHPVTELESWDHDFYPFAFMRYCKRPVGFWGQGLIEQIEGIQRELNFLLWVVQSTLGLVNVAKLWIPTGSGVVIDHLDNDIGSVLRSDQPPQWIGRDVINPEVFARISACVSDAYQQTGVSQMNAGGEKPPGELSGEALRITADIASERMATLGMAYEDFNIELARLHIVMVQECVEKTGSTSYEVSIPNRDSLEVIDWNEIKLGQLDGFRVRCFPTSTLPSDVSGRLQTAQELVQAGIIDPDTFLDVLQMPDIERIESLHSATRNWIALCLDKIVNEGKYTSPEPFDNLQLGMKFGISYYAKGKTGKLPEDRLRLLRRWLADCQALVRAAMPPPAPAGPPSQPLGAPQPPQQSALIPNAPTAQAA